MNPTPLSCSQRKRGRVRALGLSVVLLLNSTVKGIAIHTADECGAVGHPGPDYKFGWGLPNGERAVNLINVNVTTGNGASYLAKRLIKEVTLNSGSSITFPVRSSGSAPLKVTGVWTDPVIYPLLTPALNPTTSVLANDIDVRVIGPGSQTHYPWSLNPAPYQRGNAATRSGDNAVDNVEQVQIDSPGSNEDYTVQVTHENPRLGLQLDPRPAPPRRPGARAGNRRALRCR